MKIIGVGAWSSYTLGAGMGPIDENGYGGAGLVPALMDEWGGACPVGPECPLLIRSQGATVRITMGGGYTAKGGPAGNEPQRRGT